MKETIDDIAREYADHRVSKAYPDLDETNLPRNSKMSLKIFDGYDIQIAVEDGEKIVLNKIEEAINIGSADHVSLNAVKECIKQLRGNINE